MVNFTWFGHSCFEARDSVTVLMDPHDGVSLGLPVPSSSPDVVLISHDHDDHAGGRHLYAEPGVEILDGPGEFEVRGVKIRGVEAYHDDVQGERLGANVVFVFQLGGVRFAHLGDLGHPLSPEQVDEIGAVDVLMVGAGRNRELAWGNVEKVGPRIVVPMHYWTEGIIFPYFPLPRVEEFTRGRPGVVKIDGSEREYAKESLPKAMEIHVFSL